MVNSGAIRINHSLQLLIYYSFWKHQKQQRHRNSPSGAVCYIGKSKYRSYVSAAASSLLDCCCAHVTIRTFSNVLITKRAAFGRYLIAIAEIGTYKIPISTSAVRRLEIFFHHFQNLLESCRSPLQAGQQLASTLVALLILVLTKSLYRRAP